MNEPEFFVTPGYGHTLLADLRYSQAVRVGDRIGISGQGGWDDKFNFPAVLAEEIVRAFDNVERTLATAGATWSDVIAVDSFHIPEAGGTIGDAHTQARVEQFRYRMEIGHRSGPRSASPR